MPFRRVRDQGDELPEEGAVRVRRSGGAAALAFAVVAGALGGAAGDAAAAPAAPGTAPAASPDGRAEDPAARSAQPAVWPRPQSLRATGAAVTVTDEVALVAGEAADPYAVEALRTLLAEAGARRVVTLGEDEPLPPGALVVRAGDETAARSVRGAYDFGGHPGSAAQDGSHAIGTRTVPPGPGAAGVPGPRSSAAPSTAGTSVLNKALTALGATPRADLPSGGYRLAVGRVDGRDTVAMAGVGGDGLFHAVQTLRQLLDGRRVTGVVVRDWPVAAVRGVTEGFYGTPWTQEQRLAQLDFLGRTKQNRYLYAPGDDLYRQARWREAYPANQRADFRELADRARRNHVTLAWAVAPGQAMCLSSAADVRALNRKLDAMWALGVRAFQLQFQDVSYSEWGCEEDVRRFGSGPEAAARAHAEVANAVARHLKARHPGAAALSLMPTEYYQDGATAYRKTLAGALGEDVEVAWTGVGVVPRTITGRELAEARSAFAHPLVTMDNYPVNDYAQDRIFLGPYTGREPAVAAGSAALLANAMQQAEASRIPLFTAADYAWNPRAYRPQESWRAAVEDLAGDDSGRRRAVRALAANAASSVLGGEESAYLRPLIEEFWQARTGPDTAAGTAPGGTGADRAGAAGAGPDGEAARRLRAAFGVLRDVPAGLGGPLASEVAPWANRLARYGAAGEHAVDMLGAQSAGDTTAAWREYLALKELRGALKADRVTVGEGVLDPFLERAAQAYERWSGIDGEPAAGRAPAAGGRTVHLSRTRTLSAVTVLSDPGTTGTVEVRLPDAGWLPVGALDTGGATEIAVTGGLRADAVRVTGPAPARVRHLIPWYADTPEASLELPEPEADVELGGRVRVTARLTPQRPSDVDGSMRVEAPAGIGARVPKRSTLPRGTAVDVPVEIEVPADTPAGVYRVTVAFGEEERTLTLRAYPRTAGPDLARAGTASSSGDETDDFPASAANDGERDTRWSSPAEDGAWWQVELARPARVGRVVLRWQEAYASRYRVQVSADGRTWRTAATVDHGTEGRASIGMDARDTRFVRVQGDKRATRYGISLWSAEVYAVAE